VHGADAGAPGLGLESGSGGGREEGVTRGSHPLVAAGAGERRRAGWAALLCWAATRWTRPKRTGGGYRLLLTGLKLDWAESGKG
jgi:hypothetical protein